MNSKVNYTRQQFGNKVSTILGNTIDMHIKQECYPAKVIEKTDTYIILALCQNRPVTLTDAGLKWKNNDDVTPGELSVICDDFQKAVKSAVNQINNMTIRFEYLYAPISAIDFTQKECKATITCEGVTIDIVCALCDIAGTHHLILTDGQTIYL